LIEHEVNRGHIATYNDGLKQVRGDYVVLLSADDVLTPGSLARSTALLERHPEVGLVYGYPLDFHDAPVSASTRASSWTTWPGEDWVRRVCVRGRNIIVNPEAVLRRSLLEEVDTTPSTPTPQT
jgi:cellulose synthase/poly-beta-1,6-N-acetylglucosamine synthase-like glycosyltransferase